MQHEQVLKFRPLWLSLGWLLVASVWYLSLTPSPPQIDIGIDFFDKISHFTAYAVMMGWFMQLYQVRRTRMFYALGFIAMGVSIEFLQGMGSARMFEVADMLANGFGVFLAFVFIHKKLSKVLCYCEQIITKKNVY